MGLPRAKVVLWIGPKHSGKSTAARRLIDRVVAEGFSVAGILAPAIYQGSTLVGFDVVNIATERRLPLARHTEKRIPNGDAGGFAFFPSGLRFGNAALQSSQSRSAALVIVDEFGPMELRGNGWRHAVDQLVSESPGTLLLVVRKELADDVCQVYAQWDPECILAAERRAVCRLLHILHQNVECP